jgi:sugar phosphate isomerase/epimerase
MTIGADSPGAAGDLSRFAVHTVTTKPWSIETAVDSYARAGFGGISIWRDTLAGREIAAVRRRMREAGLAGVSLVRGGFFANADPAKRWEALEENRRCIAEAAELGLPLIVLVCGADPAQSLDESRRQITEALATLAPEAAQAGVRLGIEPLHPMYADTRSAVNSLTESNDIAAAVRGPAYDYGAKPAAVRGPETAADPAAPTVCSVVDVYHLWWDPRLEAEIRRAGVEGVLGAFHVCDWKVPTEHMLLDRGLMGEGCIDLPRIRSWVEEAGFDGFIEVEIFSERYWAMDQEEWLGMVAQACRDAV